jgi:transcriptional regulator with XRE-family HTH domain
MIIGERIKKKRIDKKYSQEELGRLIGVSKVSVCGYEAEKRTPTLTVLLKLMTVLNVSLDYLVGKDVIAINEDEEKYSVFISNEDMEIIKELKKNRNLYKEFLTDSKRTIELINRKLNK